MSPTSSHNIRGCSVCRRPIALTASGVVRCHGPRSSRCPGSGLLPAVPATCTSSSLSSSSSSLSAVSSSLLPPSVVVTSDQQQALHSPPHLQSSIPPCRPSAKFLKRIPKASRDCCGRKLAAILGAVVADNNHEAWYRLLRLVIDARDSPSEVENDGPWPPLSINRLKASDHGTTARLSREPRSSSKSKADPIEALASRVAAKLEEGDYRGAVRFACSEDTGE